MVEPPNAPPHSRGMAGKRREPIDPNTPQEFLVRGLTGAELAALNAIADRRNASAQPGYTTNRNAMVCAVLREFIAREKGGE